MDTTRLLPCPFCGGEAEESSTVRSGYENNLNDPYAYFFFVECKKCRARGGTNVRTPEVAIRLWNKRLEIPRVNMKPQQVNAQQSNEATEQIDPLKEAFKSWLYLYEVTVTERWDKLAISEIHTLCDEQWREFSEEYQKWLE